MFYNRAKKSQTPGTVQDFLEVFFTEWFLLYEEDSRLTRFEREAAEHWRRKVFDLDNMGGSLLMH